MKQVQLIPQRAPLIKMLAPLMSMAWLAGFFGCSLAMAQPTQGRYQLRLDQPAQTILGLGIEIQSGSIGSENLGLPDKVVAVPYDLIASERRRLDTEMLKGFRYCCLAMGLYLRGPDSKQKRIIERYPGQLRDLKKMADAAGIEGFAPEYWSPAPYWKSNGQFRGGSLKSFETPFLNEFADALVADVRYLQQHGSRVAMWGLQNEPVVGHSKYSTCAYSGEQYYAAMKITAPNHAIECWIEQ